MTGSLNRYLAELLGAFVLIGVGSMAILSSGGSIAAIAFGFGLALLIALYMFGSVSGGHYNPAVTLAQLIRGQITAADAVGYIVAQLAGAVLASGLVAAVLGASAVGRTVVGDGADIGSIWVLALEALFTAFLVIVILRVTSGESAAAPVVIGLTLVVIHLALVPITGASVNPVRSLGPAIVAADFTDAWAYIVGPLVGGAVAVYVDRFINAEAS
ncbi:MAG: aquaporin [bacterium]|nr:aquaporin [bacterium]